MAYAIAVMRIEEETFMSIFGLPKKKDAFVLSRRVLKARRVVHRQGVRYTFLQIGTGQDHPNGSELNAQDRNWAVRGVDLVFIDFAGNDDASAWLQALGSGSSLDSMRAGSMTCGSLLSIKRMSSRPRTARASRDSERQDGNYWSPETIRTSAAQ